FDRFNLGAHCGDAPRNVQDNRAALRTLAGLPADPCWLRQVHGTRVVEVDRSACAQASSQTVAEADAAFTRDAEVVLAVLTADCLPVLFCSDDGRCVAVAHAG